MIELDVTQGSPEWQEARLGIPTASQFNRIMTVKTLKPSGQAETYMNELLAEWILGESADNLNSVFMDRGLQQEDDAIRYYELQQDLETRKVGFCLRDDKRVGCSPDRLVGETGGLEIKCPAAKTHVGYLLGSPVDDYKAQIQGCLYITGRDWWDILSFNPYMPPALVRCQRDDKFIVALRGELDAFLAKLDEKKTRLIKLGVNPIEGAVPEGWPFD